VEAISLTARLVFASAPDFHHARLFSFFTVFAAKLAALFGGTITDSVGTFGSGVFFSHEIKTSFSFGFRSLNQLSGILR